MSEERQVVKYEESTLEEDIVLEPIQIRFLKLYLTGDYTHKELAEILRVHPNTIGNWLRNKDVRRYIVRYQEEEQRETKDKLNALTNKAVNAMNELLDSPMDAIRYQAARDILDRAGHNASRKVDIKKEITSYDKKMELIAETIDVIDEEDVPESISERDVLELASKDYGDVDEQE